MYVLGIDVETTGLNYESDQIIELGAVVWDTKLNKPVATMNHLISINNRQLSDEISAITGITNSELKDFGIEEEKALNELLTLAKKCDYIVAHNGNSFDKLFIDNALNKYGLTLNKPWIDTMFDVPFPSNIIKRKLGYLADEHNCSIAFAHRALFDVLAMLQICSKYNWVDIFELQKCPTIKIIALVSYEERDKAKTAGFYFDRETKKWTKKIKESQYKMSNFDFETTQ